MTTPSRPPAPRRRRDVAKRPPSLRSLAGAATSSLTLFVGLVACQIFGRILRPRGGSADAAKVATRQGLSRGVVPLRQSPLWPSRTTGDAGCRRRQRSPTLPSPLHGGEHRDRPILNPTRDGGCLTATSRPAHAPIMPSRPARALMSRRRHDPPARPQARGDTPGATRNRGRIARQSQPAHAHTAVLLVHFIPNVYLK